MYDDPQATKQRIEQAIRLAVEYSGKSRVMNLIREEFLREALLVAEPILTAPYRTAIAVLEERLRAGGLDVPRLSTRPSDEPPPPIDEDNLRAVRRALAKVADAIGEVHED